MAGITTPTRDTEIELFSLGGHDGHLREVNEAFARLLGLTPEEVNGRSLLELVHPDDLERVVAGLGALEGGAEEVLLECQFLQRDGRGVHLRWVARSVAGTDLWRAAGRDTTEFHRLLSDREALRARLDLALGQATAGMWELDVRLGLFTWEPQAVQALGVADGAVPTTRTELAAAVHPEDSAALLVAMQQLVDTGITEVGVRVGQGAALRHLSLRGKILDRDRRGRPVRAVGLVLDVTTEKAMEEQMLRMVMSDALTGVPNRRAFDQALRSEWRRCTRSSEPLSVIMIDIDDFKAFNDTFGHLVGDDALCAVARVLAATLNRAGDVVARFGGEEFAVVLPGTDSDGAKTVADRLVECVRSVVVRQAAGRGLSVSVGSASWHAGAETLTSVQLLDRADEALYAAKAAGKDRAVGYEGAVADGAAFEAAIGLGLTQGEFELYYQPILALAASDVIGFEALIRWNRPGHGLVPPDSFIPAAEASSLICDIGRWTLIEATRQLASWSQDGLDPLGELRVAVNASGRHVGSQEIVTDVASALAAAGIAADRLELELTETALVDTARADNHLAQIRALGVSVAIDDFGTGYASVGQLAQLPVDTVKIDRSFVASTDPRQRGLVALMVKAAHAFDLRVVAEGIEDAETLQMVRDLDCDYGQGYLICRPMPASQVASWLVDWRAQRLATAGSPAH